MTPATSGTRARRTRRGRWWAPGHWPLRVRLLTVAMVLIAGALTATAIALAVLMQQFLVRQVDDFEQRVRGLLGLPVLPAATALLVAGWPTGDR